MAHVQVTYWRDIPTLVTVWEGTEQATRPLSPRFQELVDLVAMKDGRASSEDYLEEWRAEDVADRPGSPAEVAAAVAEELEARYWDLRTRALAPEPRA